MTTQQLNYFNNMQPGEIFQVTKAKDWMGFIAAAKEYIDQTGLLEFDAEYTQVTKLHPFPVDGKIGFYLQ